MNKLIFLFFITCFISFWSYGQEGIITSGGEVISPLPVNGEVSRFHEVNAGTLAKSPGSNFYFILDTLTLPFIDDFSTYTIKSYDTLTYNQAFVVDSLSFSFTVDGIPLDSFSCVSDTTWSYLYSDSVVPSVVSQSPLTQYQIVSYSDPSNPFVPTDITYCWSPFEVYDTVNQSSPDTIDSLNIIIDTLINSIDTMRVYPPDTGSGGSVLSLWIDEHTFINSRYPIDPPTLGVATFDGLDEFGRPYNNFSDPLGYGVADYLTSKPIDLSFQFTDSVYISFYYQPEGIGNDPQDEDSLVLEFYAPKTRTWVHAWSTPGKSLHPFKHVIQHISDTNYLQNGFQFRFKNYGTISGAFDHWSVDYVRIDINRNELDSVLWDVAVIDATRSVFQNFEAIPWKHYLADTTFTMLTDMSVNIANLDSVDNNTGYRYYIKHNDG
ncbi:MAG: hypothetical protein JKX73_06820 [Flavobacteriales bacterium]|nr:hypothetical protein [Flavobacteriales bacterium]